MNTSTQQIENNKNFDFELNFIEKLYSLNSYKVNILGHEDVKARLSKNQGTFNLEINARLIEEDEDNFDFSFLMDDNIYETKKLEVRPIIFRVPITVYLLN